MRWQEWRVPKLVLLLPVPRPRVFWHLVLLLDRWKALIGSCSHCPSSFFRLLCRFRRYHLPRAFRQWQYQSEPISIIFSLDPRPKRFRQDLRVLAVGVEPVEPLLPNEAQSLVQRYRGRIVILRLEHNLPYISSLPLSEEIDRAHLMSTSSDHLVNGHMNQFGR